MTSNDTTTLSRRTFLGAGAVVAAAALAGCTVRGFSGGEQTERHDWTFGTTPIREIRVTSEAGDVTVVGRSTDEVAVTAMKRSWNGQRGLDSLDARTILDDGLLTVHVTADDRRLTSGRSPRVDLTIEVPKGDQGPEITAVNATFGEVSLTDTRGDTVAEVTAGAVLATRVDGYLSLRATAGRIEAADVTGLDEVYTEAGRIKVDLLDARRDVSIRSEVGEVVVGVADDLDLDILAEADGEVSSDLDLADARTRRNRVTGRLNDGGNRLHAVSELGRVALRRIEG